MCACDDDACVCTKSAFIGFPTLYRKGIKLVYFIEKGLVREKALKCKQSPERALNFLFLCIYYSGCAIVML